MEPREVSPLHRRRRHPAWAGWPRLVLASALGAMLAACQLPAQRSDAPVNTDQDRVACEGDLGPGRNTQLATIEQMIADGRSYAALAQLDAMQATTRKAIWLRAEALRRIDKLAEAATLYQQLTPSCMAGRAHHGLGLIAAQTGRWPEALNDLQQARTLQPLDTRVRNDLGYALLINRRWDEARFEFLTVLDLAPADGLASRNLVLMAHMQGKPELAQALVSRFKLDADTNERLARQAVNLMKQPTGVWLSPPPVPSALMAPPAAPPNWAPGTVRIPDNPLPAASEPTLTPLTSPASGAS